MFSLVITYEISVGQWKLQKLWTHYRSGSDWSTVHGSDYFSQMPIYKKNVTKQRTNLLFPKGKFDSVTVHREKYIPQKLPTEKGSKLPRPTTSIGNHNAD